MYKGCADSMMGVHPSMHHRKGSTLIYRGNGDSLKGVGPFNDSLRGAYSHFKGMW